MKLSRYKVKTYNYNMKRNVGTLQTVPCALISLLIETHVSPPAWNSGCLDENDAVAHCVPYSDWEEAALEFR